MKPANWTSLVYTGSRYRCPPVLRLVALSCATTSLFVSDHKIIVAIKEEVVPICDTVALKKHRSQDITHNSFQVSVYKDHVFLCRASEVRIAGIIGMNYMCKKSNHRATKCRIRALSPNYYDPALLNFISWTHASAASASSPPFPSAFRFLLETTVLSVEPPGGNS